MVDHPSTPQISVVIPCHNEATGIAELSKQLCAVLAPLDVRFELVVIDDGSQDDTLNAFLSSQKLAGSPQLHAVELSRNFGKEAALVAGLDHASGDAVVVMDADGQDPPDLIPAMVERWRQGFEVVYAQRQQRRGDSLLKRWSARLFYRIFNRLSDTPIPYDVGDFRLMDRCVVDTIRAMPERNRFHKGLFAWAGFRQCALPYDRPERHSGHSSWSPLQLCRLAMDGICSFSNAPLRLWLYLGAIISTSAFAYASYLVLRTLIYGRDVPGYASLMTALLFSLGVQLLTLGTLGSYIGRIFIEVKQRPLYVVRKKHQQKSE